MLSKSKEANKRRSNNYVKRRRERIDRHNEAVANGLEGDPWVIEFRKKLVTRNEKNRANKPKYIPVKTAGSFPKGNVPHNKLTPDQKLIRQEELKEYRKKYWSDPERAAKRKLYLKEYNAKNRDKINKQKSDRIKKSPELLLLIRLRKRLSKIFKLSCVNKSARRTMDLLGCDISFFKEYIQSKFKEGMSFENYGEWHLDHIIPCAYFNFANQDDVKKCFHYTNIQPLWAIDNLKKGSKLLNAA